MVALAPHHERRTNSHTQNHMFDTSAAKHRSFVCTAHLHGDSTIDGLDIDLVAAEDSIQVGDSDIAVDVAPLPSEFGVFFDIKEDIQIPWWAAAHACIALTPHSQL